MIKLEEDNVYFIDVDDDKGGFDERGILISCTHEDENSLFGECKKCEMIKQRILDNQEIKEKLKALLNRKIKENGLVRILIKTEEIEKVLEDKK